MRSQASDDVITSRSHDQPPDGALARRRAVTAQHLKASRLAIPSTRCIPAVAASMVNEFVMYEWQAVQVGACYGLRWWMYGL
jgi:hypothetical protein